MNVRELIDSLKRLPPEASVIMVPPSGAALEIVGAEITGEEMRLDSLQGGWSGHGPMVNLTYR